MLFVINKDYTIHLIGIPTGNADLQRKENLM